MRGLDDHDHDLDALLCSPSTVQRSTAEEERLFGDVWSRVQASISDGSTSSVDSVQERRLTLIADRDLAARRRRRATRLASAALAIAVAGGRTAPDQAAPRPGAVVPDPETPAGRDG